MTRPKGRDRQILPGKLSRERIDLGLALGRQRSKIGAIALEKGAWVRCL
jgi:hypothetical protein